MRKTKQISAAIDPVLHKRLRQRLFREDRSYRAWLEARITEYLQDVNKTGQAQTKRKRR